MSPLIGWCIWFCCITTLNAQQREFSLFTRPASDMKVDGEGRVFLAASNQLLRLDSTLALQENMTLGSSVLRVALSSDERRLVVCLSDLSCAVYNASDFGAGEQLRRTGASASSDEVALFTGEENSFYVGSILSEAMPFMNLGQYGFGDRDFVRSMNYRIDRRGFTRRFFGGFVSGTNTYYFMADDNPREVRGLRVLRACDISNCLSPCNFNALYELRIDCGGGSLPQNTVICGLSVLDSFAASSDTTVMLARCNTGTGARNRVCSFRLADIDLEMDRVYTECAGGNGNIQVAWDSGFGQRRCAAVFQVQGTCDFSLPLGNVEAFDAAPGSPVVGQVRLDFGDTQITASVAIAVDSTSIVYTGYTNSSGSFVGAFYITATLFLLTPGNSFYTRVMSSPVRQIQWESELEYIYVTTESSVLQIPLEECANFTDCESCISYNNPLCGWCTVEDKCCRRSQCQNAVEPVRWVQNSSQCISTTITPNQFVLDDPEILSVTVTPGLPPLLTNESYWCQFADNEGLRVITVDAEGVTPNTTYQCNITGRIPTFTGVQLVTDFSFVSSKAGIPFATNMGTLTVTRCESAASCSQCLQTDNICGWCIYNQVCSGTPAPCTNETNWLQVPNCTEPTAVDCDALPNPVNGLVNDTNGTTFGQTATYSCNTGYNLTGNSSRMCEATGMWSGSAPSCETVDCGALPNPVNGLVNHTNGTTFGQTATYSCNAGYNLVGNSTRMCEAIGMWSGTSAPSCEIAPTILEPPENLTVVHPQSATFLCNATAQPRPEITWWRMGNQLLEQPRAIEINAESFGEMTVVSNLTIIMADPSDASGYICMATNIAGQDTAAAELTVHVIPEVVFPNGSFTGYVVNVTDPVTFECNATGIPPPTIQWFRGDMLLRPHRDSEGNGEIRVSAGDSRLVSSELSQVLIPTAVGNIYQVGHTLTFNTTANDTDTYSCMASNTNEGQPTATQDFTLFVQVPPIVVPLTVIRNETESATLAFGIDEAVPLVLLQDLRWFYVADLGSDPYVGQEITNLMTRTTGSTLIFSDFTNMRYINLTIVQRGSTVSGETDQGRYFLVATNPAGMSSAYIDLLTQVSRDIQMIGEIQIDEKNAQEVINNLTMNVETVSEDDQIAINFAVITEVIVNSSSVVMSGVLPLQQQINITMDVLQIIDSVSTWPVSVTSTTSPRIIEAFEVIVVSTIQNENFTRILIEENDVALLAERVDQEDLEINGRTFGARTSDDGQVMVVNVTTSTLSEASISLPPSLFAELENATEVGVGFTFYETAALFPLPEGSPSNLTIGSSVIGALVGGQSFSNLRDPVTIFLRLRLPPLNPQCASWNFAAAGGRGNWTTEECELVEIDGNAVTCRCNHLTNFGCLVDICTRTDGCQELPPPIQLALDIISITGTSLSLFGLAMTIISLLVFKKLRKRDVSKLHIQLCIALFCMLIVFVSGIDQTQVYGGCVTVSALLHYFTLVMWMWMGAEAVFMFQKLVIVFGETTTRYMIAISLVCWLVPIVPVVIPLAIDQDFMVTFSPSTINGTKEPNNATEMHTIRYCFIGEPGVFFGAFLGPIFAIMLFNATIFVIITTVLIKHSRKRFSNKDKAKRQTVVKLTIGIIGVMTLFGLMWVFGALTIREASITFQFLFAIFNSLQGFFIFLFFCVLGKDTRELWLHALCCGRKIPGIKVSTNLNTKQPKYATLGKKSEPNVTSTGLRSAPPTSPRSPAFQFSNIAGQSNMFSESNPMALPLEALEESYLDKPQLAKVKEASLLQQELEITGDGQHNNGSTQPTAKASNHKAKHLQVLVRRSSTLHHHVETAEVYLGDSTDDSDSEVIANPISEAF